MSDDELFDALPTVDDASGRGNARRGSRSGRSGRSGWVLQRVWTAIDSRQQVMIITDLNRLPVVHANNSIHNADY